MHSIEQQISYHKFDGGGKQLSTLLIGFTCSFCCGWPSAMIGSGNPWITLFGLWSGFLPYRFLSFDFIVAVDREAHARLHEILDSVPHPASSYRERPLVHTPPAVSSEQYATRFFLMVSLPGVLYLLLRSFVLKTDSDGPPLLIQAAAVTTLVAVCIIWQHLNSFLRSESRS